MIEVHTRLRHFSSRPDPLTHVADEIADQVGGGAAGRVGKCGLVGSRAAGLPWLSLLAALAWHGMAIPERRRTPQPSSLPRVQTRVLCLDEFFVTDVADAMILHRLFGRWVALRTGAVCPSSGPLHAPACRLGSTPHWLVCRPAPATPLAGCGTGG